MHPESFKRIVAKFITRCIVSSAITNATLVAVEHTVDIEDDSIQKDAINLGAAVVGLYGSAKLSPWSDELVDTIADRWSQRKETEVVTVTAE